VPMYRRLKEKGKGKTNAGDSPVLCVRMSELQQDGMAAKRHASAQMQGKGKGGECTEGKQG